MKFLIVDDSSTMRKIVSLALSGAGHEFAEAENGKEALGLVGSGGFACIILDINMPEMNGLEFLEANRKLPTSSTPVVVLTTQDEEELRKKALDLGAKAFMVKPFKKEELLATLASIGMS
jgi:two-component system, chemotaxis family, chemotaxis protein CheY